MINKIKTFCTNFFSKRENLVKFAYCCALIFSSVAFGLLFAKLIGGIEEIELGNSFTHAFSVGTYHVLIMIALLLVLSCFTWCLVNTILLFIPATEKIMFEETNEKNPNKKLYTIIHLCSFTLLGIYTCLVFFLSRIIIMEEVDNGILPAAGFLGVFSLLAFVATGLANCILNYNLFVKDGKKEVKKVETPKETPKVAVKVEKKEEEEEEEKRVSLEEILKAAAIKKEAPKREKKEGEKEEVEEPKELFNKKLMSKAVKETYPELIYEGRENYTSTGLPLADTYYVNTPKGKRCFMYVYETVVHSLILCKISKDYYKKLKGKKDLMINKSEFPKSNVAWASLVLDYNVDKDLVLEIVKEASEFVNNEAEADEAASETKPATKKPADKKTAAKKPATTTKPATTKKTAASSKPATKKTAAKKPSNKK